MINPIRSNGGAAGAGEVSAPSNTSASATPGGLPYSQIPSLPPAGDSAASLEMTLTALQSQMSDKEIGAAKTQVQINADRMKEEHHKVAEKLKEAQDDSDSWWGDVLDVASVVAAASATVVTLGAAAPLMAVAIAGLVLTSASALIKHTDLKKDIDPDWQAGIAIGGAVCSATSGGIAALGAGGAVSTAARVGGAIQGVAGVTQGVAAVGSAYAQHEAIQAYATAQDAKAVAEGLQAETDDTLGRAKDLVTQIGRLQSRVAKMIETQHDNTTALLRA